VRNSSESWGGCNLAWNNRQRLRSYHPPPREQIAWKPLLLWESSSFSSLILSITQARATAILGTTPTQETLTVRRVLPAIIRSVRVPVPTQALVPAVAIAVRRPRSHRVPVRAAPMAAAPQAMSDHEAPQAVGRDFSRQSATLPPWQHELGGGHAGTSRTRKS
jgi:hypothetical protein